MLASSDLLRRGRSSHVRGILADGTVILPLLL
jgi:hypothetical protein